MDIQFHPSVKAVVEFMQRNIPADELQGVAVAVATLAPAVWGRYPVTVVYPLRLVEPPIGCSTQYPSRATA